MRSCPMYSSIVRGRRPASYWRSSSARDAADQPRRRSVRLTAPAHRDSCRSARRSSPRTGASAGAPLTDGVDRLVDGGRLVAEIDQRRHHVAAQPVGRRRGRRRRRGVGLGQAIAQLQRHALGGLAADAGDPRQPRHVALLDGADEVGRLDAREHRQRQLRADAVDRDQPLEQLVLERGREAEQRDLILADVGVDAQRDRPRRARRPGRTSTPAPARRSRRRGRRRSGGWDASRAGGRAARRSSGRLRSDLVVAPAARQRRRAGAGARLAPCGDDRAVGEAAACARGRWPRPARPRRRTAPAASARPSSSLTMCCTWCFSARP